MNLRPLKWFKDRVGKTIYRDKITCPCLWCFQAFCNGLIITDKDHAQYLFDIISVRL